VTWDEWILLFAGVVLLLGWATWVEASRLDRLHRKVTASQAVLDRQLVRRATVAVELASAGVMDPVSSVLVGEAAFAALEVSDRGPDPLAPPMPDLLAPPMPDLPAPLMPDPTDPVAVVDRGLVESELSSTVRAALEDPAEVAFLREEPGGAELVDALAAAWYRVQLARRFHNAAVAQTLRVRRQPVVRTLRLAGRAPAPQALEFDDAWPEALGRPGASDSVPPV